MHAPSPSFEVSRTTVADLDSTLLDCSLGVCTPHSAASIIVQAALMNSNGLAATDQVLSHPAVLWIENLITASPSMRMEELTTRMCELVHHYPVARREIGPIVDHLLAFEEETTS